jgi:hypothetical protein
MKERTQERMLTDRKAQNSVMPVLWTSICSASILAFFHLEVELGLFVLIMSSSLFASCERP